jgi:hypothetical protein
MPRPTSLAGQAPDEERRLSLSISPIEPTLDWPAIQLAGVDGAIVVAIGDLETLLDESEIFDLVERVIRVRMLCGHLLRA